MKSIALGLLLALAVPSQEEPVAQGQLSAFVDSITMAPRLYNLGPTEEWRQFPIAWMENRPWRCTEDTSFWPFPPTLRGWKELYQQPVTRGVFADFLTRDMTFREDPECFVSFEEPPGPPEPPAPPSVGDSIPVPYAVAIGGAFWHVLVDWDPRSQHTTLHGGLREGGLRAIECIARGVECPVRVCSDPEGDGFCYRIDIRWVHVDTAEPPEDPEDPEDPVDPPVDPPAPGEPQRIQSAVATGISPSLTLEQPAQAGNLLVATLWHRNDWTNPRILAPGWDLLAQRLEPTPNTHRKSIAVFGRRVSEGDPLTIEAAWDGVEPGRENFLVVEEFSGFGDFRESLVVSSEETERDFYNLPSAEGLHLGILGTRETPFEGPIWEDLSHRSFYVLTDASGIRSSLSKAFGFGFGGSATLEESFIGIAVLLTFEVPNGQ